MNDTGSMTSITQSAGRRPEWRIDDGPTEYPDALAAMQARVATIRAGTAQEQVWLVEHPPISWIDTGDHFDSNVREDRYAMALFGTILVLLIGLLGRRVGRAVPRVNAACCTCVAPASAMW